MKLQLDKTNMGYYGGDVCSVFLYSFWVITALEPLRRRFSRDTLHTRIGERAFLYSEGAV